MAAIVYENADWRVYADGTIKAKMAAPGGYFVGPETIAVKDYGGDWFHNPIHVCGKPWCRPPLYVCAWLYAMSIACPDAPRDWLVRSIERALGLQWNR